MVILNINTQQLRYFMELAKCLNFTRAAANLYVAQPTLSQQIAELEAQLGVILFNRSSRTVSLTPAGAILQRAYPDIMAQLEHVQQHMLNTAAGFSGSLNIGFLENFVDIIPTFIRDFKNEFPDVAVKPINGSLNDLNNGLKNQTMDVVLSLIQDFAPDEQAAYNSRMILLDPLGFVLSGDHPVPSDYSFALSTPLVTFDMDVASCYYPHISERLKRLGIQVPKVIYTRSLMDIQVYIESGIGFSILPSNLAASFSTPTQFIPIPGEYLKFGTLWNPNSTNPALPLFLDTLDQFLNPESDIAAALPV